jgi:hypothetical protein
MDGDEREGPQIQVSHGGNQGFEFVDSERGKFHDLDVMVSQLVQRTAKVSPRHGAG